MSEDKPLILARNSKGTIDVRLPAAFYKKLWSDVATVEAEELVHKGLKRRRLSVGPDGRLIPINEVV
ncbi:MAG: hypothetical protein Q7S53_03890 [bacterium]|nr:hypothetical protein [bacterium]